MRKYLNYVKGIFMLLLVLFLFAFSSVRNNARTPASINIHFNGENPLFIAASNVDKMLIQNQEYIECVTKDVLDLKALESTISSHEMIETAEVYLTVDGGLKIDIEQRKPLARVVSDPSFYIDRQGQPMPLSDAYSARVLLVHGNVTNSNIEIIYQMLMAIENDAFLKLYATDLIIDAQNQISMRTRDCSFEILIGDLNRLDQKIINFKAFYQKAKKDSLLKDYKQVNLKFNQQVVGIK